METVHFAVSSYIRPDKSLQMELDVTAPKTPGTYPTMLYLSGLEGVAPNWFQTELINDTVKQGHVWLTVKCKLFSSPASKEYLLKK